MNRLVLLNALKAVMPGIEEKESLLEGVNSFVFDGKWVKTYNDSLSVSFPLEVGISCAVKAKEFFKILGQMSGEEVTLTEDQNKLIVSDKVTTLTMNLIKEDFIESCIQNMFLENVEWKKLPSDFYEGMRYCSYSVAHDVSFGTLNSICFFGNKGISSDNYRASQYTFKSEMDSFLLESSAVTNLLKLGVFVECGVGSSWVHFRNEVGVTFSCRRVIGEFPVEDVLGFFGGAEEAKKYSFPVELLKSLSRVGALAYGDDQSGLEYITLAKKGSSLLVTGEKAFGSITDTIVVNGDFPEITLNISPKFLKDILPHTREFYMVGGSLLMFNVGTFSHLVSLIQG